MKLLGRLHALPIVLALVLALAPVGVRGETLEELENPRVARGGWVTDAAGVLSPTAEAKIDSLAAGLQRQTGHELALVTVHDTGERSPREFATALLNAWGIGRKGHDDGVLILIATDVHRIEVETGYGVESVLPDGRVGRILDSHVMPALRKGDWDAATVGGTREFARILATWETEAAAEERSREGRRGLALLLSVGVAILTALGAALGFGLRYWRRCPKCHRTMRVVPESEEAVFLAEAERFEEGIGSVDHRVWRCDLCPITRIEHHKRWASGYHDCPKCKRTTLALRSLTLLAATYEHAGRKEVTGTCRSPGCGYKTTETHAIPRLEHTSSSSGSFGSSGGSGRSGGSSFGGGSSGGGGAGRSW